MGNPAALLAAKLRDSARWSVEEVDGDTVAIDRDDMPPVVVRVIDSPLRTTTDVAALGVADVDALVIVGEPAYWLSEAKAAAQGADADVYTLEEFFTALNSKRFKGSQLGTIHHFVETVRRHDRVSGLVRAATKVFDIERIGGLDVVRVYVADEYMLPEQFVDDVLDVFPTTVLIANISPWNNETPEALSRARERNSVVVDRRELFRALNFNVKRLRASGTA